MVFMVCWKWPVLLFGWILILYRVETGRPLSLQRKKQNNNPLSLRPPFPDSLGIRALDTLSPTYDTQSRAIDRRSYWFQASRSGTVVYHRLIVIENYIISSFISWTNGLTWKLRQKHIQFLVLLDFHSSKIFQFYLCGLVLRKAWIFRVLSTAS